MPAPAKRPVPPKWSQLIISLAVGALFGLLWGLWRGDLARWVLLGAVVGALSGVWAEMRASRHRSGNER